MERLRTPEEEFENLPDFDFTPCYGEVTDPTGDAPLRMAYLDEGNPNGEVIVLLHGEPSWSFLYRKMIPVLATAGYRVIAPDLIGFGRSDKPTHRTDYTYERHVEWVRELLLDVLGLSNITLFGQDWGSLVGLRVLAENVDSFKRLVLGNAGLPTGDERMNPAFTAWQEYSQSAPELHIGRIIGGGCKTPLSEEIVRAYDAPFPDDRFKEGARQFPLLVPTTPQDPAHDANVAAWEVLKKFTKPVFLCFSDSDPITAGGDRKFRELIPGASGVEHVTITEAAHFLQEDKGEEIAEAMVSFMRKN